MERLPSGAKPDTDSSGKIGQDAVSYFSAGVLEFRG